MARALAVLHARGDFFHLHIKIISAIVSSPCFYVPLAQRISRKGSRNSPEGRVLHSSGDSGNIQGTFRENIMICLGNVSIS
jgi:hypothetical protein